MGGAALPHNLRDVVKGVCVCQGQAVVTLGPTILVLKRIPGGALLIVAFAIEEDRVFVGATSMVPAILLISFVLGNVE
jgi:uncharacterized membrane protein